jgi:glucan biosynthesis protein
MPKPTVSFEELESLHDVLEAARCFWHPRQADHARAAETLRLANRLYWRLGEELPKTGTPSERFLSVTHSSQGDRVEQLLECVLDLTREYANVNNPWLADTVFASSSLTSTLSQVELGELRDSLRRLGLTLELRSDIPKDRMIAARQDLGPWYEELG